jgi:NAD(P)-dependent dehydrogenase (short-subunit alcohol dehydrogenase family)
MELEGKTVLLTGATGGLGRAMAEALAGRGATLVPSSHKPEELDALALSLAPMRQRVPANFAGRHPHLAARISGGVG